MPDLSHERARMVETQIAARGITDPFVLAAMREVPREAFVAPDLEEYAYDDGPLPIGAGQTISQPFVVALMIAATAVRPGERVLEIGAGSGYAAAVLAAIGAQVYAVERQPLLASRARQRLRDLGYAQVELRQGDGTLGWPEAAPFDAILVSAGGPEVPPALRDQLAVGGRLVIPVGRDRRRQRLLRVVRAGRDRFTEEDLGEVAFVPLIGAQGWA